MLDLWGTCRPGNFGESRVDKDGTGSKHERQEKLRELIWARLLIHENTIWPYARLVMEKENYRGLLMSLMFVKDVEVLD